MRNTRKISHKNYPLTHENKMIVQSSNYNTRKTIPQ